MITQQRWRAVRPYLDHALELAGDERAAFIRSVRAQDAAVAADLEMLLAEMAAVILEGFLEGEPPRPPGPSQLAGQSVGAYTLVRQIGEGGMGSVWLGRRSDGAFTGEAAVKLLSPALIGRAGNERFRLEGSILARLAHPNIARLLDAGVSSGGLPYLVLELVDGQPIDRYCDAGRLDVPARLRLFADVLAAVAHAHANLIVHRDIKPSNVLVGSDGRVRLLDFGIARLIEDGAAGEPSELTRRGGRLMTPEYAAPEQLAGGPLTTATDIYALGVLLYVLLSGRHPAEGALGSPADLVRAVVDGEPRRLSQAVVGGRGTSGAEAADRAASRGTTPESLERTLRGDLEMIVATAMRKSPAERYASIGSFAEDLRRYLDDEPVSARPDTLAYRTSKFVRRHASGVAAAVVLGVVAVASAGFHTRQLASERDRAGLQAVKATQVSRLLEELLTGADPFSEVRADELTVRGLLDAGAGRIESELEGQPDLQAEMLRVVGRVYQRLGLLDRAQALLERSLEAAREAFGAEHESVAASLNDLGVVLADRADLAAAVAILEDALAMRRRLLGPRDPAVAVTLVELGRVRGDQGRDDVAEPLLREALSIRLAALGERAAETATSQSELALLLWRNGQPEAAEPLFLSCLETTRLVLGDAHPDVSTALNNLALIALEREDPAAAEALLLESVASGRKALGDGHPAVAAKLSNLGNAQRMLGKHAEAAAALDEALRIATAAYGSEHPLVATVEVSMARNDLELGDFAVAASRLRHAVEVRRTAYPPHDWRVSATESLLGEALTGLGSFDDAERLLVVAASILRDLPGVQGREYRANRARILRLAERSNRPELAAAYPPGGPPVQSTRRPASLTAQR